MADDTRTDLASDGEQRLADALAPFGWTCGPDFWARYYSDPWVFNLANAVERLRAELDRARPVIDAAIKWQAGSGLFAVALDAAVRAYQDQEPGA